MIKIINKAIIMIRKNFLQRLICLTVILLCASVGVFSAEVKEIRTYNGQFTDVSQNDWYYESVAGAYSLGLISGKTDTEFKPDGSITIAESIKLAASCHQLLVSGEINDSAFASSGSNWYDGYVSYAKSKDIVTEDYENYNAYASRAMVAVLFSRAIVSSGVQFEVINEAEYGDIPDVSGDMWYAGAVYRLYRWGIMTGSSDGNINPGSTIKRSEVSAMLMRIAYPEKRVNVSSANTASSGSANTSKDESQSVAYASVELYTGEVKEQSFTGITSFGADFVLSGNSWNTSASYSLELVNNIVLENDNISFRLYKNSGYEALGIVRGWLNEAATGIDGKKINAAEDVFTALNDLFYIFIDGGRQVISELWYTDHGDYTTYAFYFLNNADVASADQVQILCGKANSDTLTLCGLGDLSVLVEKAEKGLTYTGAETNNTVVKSDTYEAALSDAKESAEILFEQEISRCTILYGRGLYGNSGSEYRLIFIYPDGTTQTIATQKLSSIRLSDNVLYYTITAPDGEKLQYGVNFGS